MNALRVAITSFGRMKKNAKKANLVPKGSVKHHFEDYCQSTSIHGIKYLGEKNRPLGERLWWLLVFLVCLLGNAYLIAKVWKKWNESPVIVSFAETTTPVWQVPFPAITICSEQKSRASIFNFTEAYYMVLNTSDDSAPDDDLVTKTGNVVLLCDDHVLVNTTKQKQFTDDSTIEFLKEVSPGLNDSLLVCKWKGELREDCSHILKAVVTEEGMCFSFNMLSPQELFRGNGIPYYEEHDRSANNMWALDGGYFEDAPLETYPERALFPGSKAGITFVFKAEPADSDFLCRGPVEGFKVLLHNPAEIPTIGERYLRVPLKQEVIVAVQPKIMTTSHGLRTYSPHGRQCYFFNERYLQFFKIYTQQNCQLECLTNYTLKECGCVAIHMPRNPDTKICGSGSKICMQNASAVLRLFEIKSSYEGETGQKSCDCLPACTSLQYDAETSQADFNAFAVLAAYKDNTSEVEMMQFARLTVFFKDMQFTTSKRSELFGLVDFMANCGGLLGLFCGVSFLSLVEIIYYITLRFWSNMKTLKQEEEQLANSTEDHVPDKLKKFMD
ncbi:pickpocket protein 28-like isoform X2 [Cimex lectularius]|uniref:Pickpocket n=1 Tax=Cimex lectularius TaxID=79782 RepID=A0A8I6SFI9_CIMLE|nr:pickpocket protein 28-like isoform X2 [Cimex lectularius]